MKKEVLEITHAGGYEHPSQMLSSDVELSMGDNNFTQTLEDAYGYKKDPVPFESVQKFADCKHLGAIDGAIAKS